MSIPQVIISLTDPRKDHLGRTKRQRIRILIDYMKARDATKGNDMKMGEMIFMGVETYLPLYRYKGCTAFKTVDEIEEAL